MNTERRYDIEQVLGQGGFGTVYRARLSASGGFTKHVALKVLNADVASSTDVLQRLRDEARMLGLLRHRAIVHVEGLVHLEDRWAVVMEFVDGASLSELIRTGPVPPSVALEICEEVAAALDVAYARPASSGEVLRLLHRDIKPSNVQLTAQGEIKLLDFGVARADFGEREAQTRSLILGSVDYLAPERLEMIDSHAGDIYALGATLFELLMGEPLGRASINPRKHAANLDERRRELLAKVDDPALATVIFDAVAYEETERPDANTLARQLRELRRKHAEPWLRDWAERAVPRAQALRPVTPDDWSGATLYERTSTNTGSDTMAFDLEPLMSEPTAPAPPEPAPSVPRRAPAAARAPVPPTRPRRRHSPVWTCAVVTLATVTLTAIVLAVTSVLVPTLFVGLLSSSGILAAAWDDTVKETMTALEQEVRKLPDDADRQRVLDAIEDGKRPNHTPRIGMFELVFFEMMVQEAAADGRLTPTEATDIERRMQRITSP
jgi:eukaryotic-like serine/threonine-protein kinase